MMALLLTLFVGVFIIIGYGLGIYSKNNKQLVDMSICIGFGVIAGLIIFEILPDTYSILVDKLGTFRSVLSIIILIILGIMTLKILDMFVPNHELEENKEETEEESDSIKEDNGDNHLKHVGIIACIAIIIHNLIEGAGLYLIAKGDMTSGVLLCLGIGLHNIPIGLVISITLLNSNLKKTKFTALTLSTILSAFIGGLIVFVIGGVSELTEGLLLGFTLGMLVYISVFELGPQIYRMKSRTLARMCILFGLAILVTSVLIGKFV